MIQLIARLTPWRIILAGSLAVLSGMFLVASLSHLGYALFTDWGWVVVFHIVGSGAAYFFISRPFVIAFHLRVWRDQYPPLDVFEEK